jgi:hypothetical protein
VILLGVLNTEKALPRAAWQQAFFFVDKRFEISNLELVQKPERLTTFSRSNVQKYKLHNNRYLQPAQCGQLIPA